MPTTTPPACRPGFCSRCNVHDALPSLLELYAADGMPLAATRLCGECTLSFRAWLVARAPSVPPTPLPSVEQMCRDLLSQAARDGLVFWRDHSPRHWTAGELTNMAALLTGYLRREYEAGAAGEEADTVPVEMTYREPAVLLDPDAPATADSPAGENPVQATFRRDAEAAAERLVAREPDVAEVRQLVDGARRQACKIDNATGPPRYLADAVFSLAAAVEAMFEHLTLPPGGSPR